METELKFVAVLNKKVPEGRVMNALAHISLGLVASSPDQKELGFINYVDGDGSVHSNISKLSYVILKADNSNQLRNLAKLAREQGLICVDFIESMTGETYKEQLNRTSQLKNEELEYFGVGLFGDKTALSLLTKKFSLW